jgi:hypothetical protein
MVNMENINIINPGVTINLDIYDEHLSMLGSVPRMCSNPLTMADRDKIAPTKQKKIITKTVIDATDIRAYLSTYVHEY